jgi:NTP pyrophosphatase (non-canonical NTP hydrolase)
MKSDIEEIIEELNKFRNERDWKQFHDGKNLAISLSIEASELLESFLWKNDSEADVNKIKQELADVFYNAFLLSDLYGFDVKKIVLEKLTINKAKYPVEKSKGSNKKYNEL